jgi:uncharacterized coiled-coil protein SlyX
MRWFGKLCFLVLVPGLVMAQTSTPTTGSTPATSVADELKALREAMTQQQQQIAQQQQQIDALQKQLGAKTAGTPHVEDAALRTNAPNDAAVIASDAQEPEKAKESPLSFRIGAADFTPGGFVDFENVFRSTNTGFVTATNFWAIPYSNQFQGHLTEYRATGQYSRFNIKTHAKFGENDITGYVEFDFNGNDAANVFVTSNPHTDRLRVYWLDLKRGKWEFLGGQTWGLQTPNRVGLSPVPADLALTIGEDAQTHVGLNYTRAAEFRAVWHPNDNFAWGFAIQNPQQYSGSGSEVTLPLAFNAVLGGQFDTASAGAANPGTPNVAPDFMTKLAWDSDPAGRHFHFEFGGVASTVKITNIAGTSFAHHAKMGGGVITALNYELIPKKLRFLASGMWGNGVGRYLIGMAPQAVVVPVATGPASFDTSLSLVHSGDMIAGFEATAGKSQFGFYYGGMYAQRNSFCDITDPAAGTCAGHKFIGFGFPGSDERFVNRAIQEATIDWTQTFWRNPQYGAVLLVTQASYVTRAPWFAALGAPKNAHLTMGYVSLRYVLP